MLDKIKDFQIKEWILSLILLIIATDITILLNIPYLREIMVFFCFTFVPGILIIHILKLNSLKFLKKLVLTIGLSICFLIFMGLALNSFYPILATPLSFWPIFITLNLTLIILAIIAYQRNKNEFILSDFLNFKTKESDGRKLNSMLLLPFLFPVMAVVGTYFMNITQNNVILMLMLFLIPAYIVALVFLKNRITNTTYPVALSMIGLSLLLMHGLTSFHVMGRDVQFEFHFFNLALKNAYWNSIGDILQFNAYNSCLSVTILPVIFKVLSNMNSEYIFKIYYALIGSILPLVLYVIFQKYFSRQNSFFAALIFIFQPYFIYFLGIARQEIALMFFLLALLVFYDNKINENIKKLLFVIFMISVVVSHYATAYVTFLVVIPILLFPFLKSVVKDRKNIKFTNFDVLAVILIFMAIWYVFVAGSQYTAASDTLNAASIGAGGMDVTSQKDIKVLAVFGMGLTSIPNAISVIVNDLIILIMGLGFLSIIWNYKSCKNQIKSSYIMGMIMSPLVLTLPLILPNLSIIYDIQRLFLQLIVFLGPLFLIGMSFITRKLKIQNLKPILILVLIISLFSCSTYLTYHLSGISYSPYYETNGSLRDEHFIYDQELSSAAWIQNNSMQNSSILTDGIAFSRLLLANNNFSTINANRSNSNYFIYLGFANVNDKLMYPKAEFPEKIEKYPNLFINKSRVYDDGGSQVLYGPVIIS